MLHKALVIFHLLGAAAWIGGHLVLVLVVLPGALKARDAKVILDFERGYGRVGLSALAIQATTGAWLASTWLGGWSNILHFSSVPAAHLVFTKLVLLGATLVQAGYAYHRVLPRLTALQDEPLEAIQPLRAFALHATSTTILAAVMLVVGASIRLGGLL